MPDLTPMTREEKFLNGDTDLTPITRREHFYAGTESTLPEPEPITREEWFIQKYRGGGGGDITVESLSVTENGTYTAPSGKAYSPVNVNVPLPQNAYLLKSVNTPTPIASFNDGEEMVMPSLKVAIEPQQDLNGYDAPWVGGSGKNLFHVDSRVPTTTISNVGFSSDDEYIYLNGTKQGGGYADLSSADITLDSGTYYIKAFVISGTASNTVELYPYDGSNNLTSSIINTERTLTLSESKTFRFRFAIWTDGTVLNNYKVGIVISKTANIDKFYPYSNICPISGWDEVDVTVADDVETPTVSNVYTIDLDGTRYGVDLDVINGIGREYKEYPSYNGETLIGPWISDRDAYAEGTTPTIGAQVVDKGDITTFNTIPTAVKSLRGVNNAYANTGDITDAEYFSKEV